MYYVIDITCDNENTARQFATCGAALSESTTTRLDILPRHSRYIDTVNGVDIWYHWSADYYFFVEVEPLCG